ncbi:MAG: DMT family transporter [Planctomycetota bacterium]
MSAPPTHNFQRGHPWAIPTLLLGMVGICASTLLVRYATDIGPVASAFWRMFLAWPIFAVIAWRLHSQAERRFSAIAGVAFAADLSLYHVSIGMTTLANACLLGNLAPVVVTVLAVWWGTARGGWRTWTALAVAIAGAVMLVKGSPHAQTPGQLTGDMIAASAAFAYAAYQLAATKARNTGGTMAVMATSGLVASLVLLPIALLHGETIVPASLHGWTIVVALAITGQLLGQGLVVWSLAHLPPAYSSVALLIQPALVALTAWPLFDETMVFIQILGGGVLLAGVWWAKHIHSPVKVEG